MIIRYRRQYMHCHFPLLSAARLPIGLALHLTRYNGYWMGNMVFCAGDHLPHHIFPFRCLEEEDFQASSRASTMADCGKSVAVGEQSQPISLPPCNQIRASHVSLPRHENYSGGLLCCHGKGSSQNQ